MSTWPSYQHDAELERRSREQELEQLHQEELERLTLQLAHARSVVELARTSRRWAWAHRIWCWAAHPGGYVHHAPGIGPYWQCGVCHRVML